MDKDKDKDKDKRYNQKVKVYTEKEYIAHSDIALEILWDALQKLQQELDPENAVALLTAAIIEVVGKTIMNGLLPELITHLQSLVMEHPEVYHVFNEMDEEHFAEMFSELKENMAQS